MWIIGLIQEPDVIRQILEHLGLLWKQDTGSRCKKPTKPKHRPVAYEDFDDLSECGHAQAGGWPGYEDTAVTLRETTAIGRQGDFAMKYQLGPPNRENFGQNQSKPTSARGKAYSGHLGTDAFRYFLTPELSVK
jgi:hypothetical protein